MKLPKCILRRRNGDFVYAIEQFNKTADAIIEFNVRRTMDNIKFKP